MAKLKKMKSGKKMGAYNTKRVSSHNKKMRPTKRKK